MSKKTWMPLYPADYLADTTRLTTEQHGAYLLLIMDYWRNGVLPDDDAALCNITRLSPAAWRKNRPAVERMFQVGDGVWRHKRIDKEIIAAEEASIKHVERAKRGAEKRWGKDATSNATSIQQAVLVGCLGDALLPSPSEKKEKKEKEISREISKNKITLAELSVDHIAAWLAEKRSKGRFTGHDPHIVLEIFRDYCLAKEVKYKDYVAAYRNAFNWDQFKNGTGNAVAGKGGGVHRGANPALAASGSWASEGQRLAAQYLAEDDRGRQSPVSDSP